uniref:Exonuclease 1 n=1 Tax=Trichuris muris TaxID=70415 RepID=A0A5S6R0J5_TRIMR
MGIKALLSVVHPACRPSHVSEFSGMRVAVDASSWLHKAAFGCSDMIARGLQSDLHITYCMKRVQMLLHNGVHVVLVFDGANLPAKSETNAVRNERRRSMKEQGKKLAAAGKFKEAADCFRLATEVTFDVVVDVIKACQGLANVACLVAPYEADAQLCYLSKAGLIDLVISEDSDLIPFGCTKVLFKMDIYGNGQLYEQEKLHLALQISIEKFDFAKFRRSCILSGCDYVSNLPGVGIRKAMKFFSKVTSCDPRKFLKMIPIYLCMPKLVISADYIERFIEAENTFLYQVVFDPTKRYQVPLNPYPDGADSSHFPYAGCICQAEVAILLAAGNLNPHNMGFSPLPSQAEPEKNVVTSSESPQSSTCAFVFETTTKKVVCAEKNEAKEDESENDSFCHSNYSMYLSESTDDTACELKRKVEGPFSAEPTVGCLKSSNVVRSSYFVNSCEDTQGERRFNPFKALSDTDLLKAEPNADAMFSSLSSPEQKRICCESAPSVGAVTERGKRVPNRVGRSEICSRNLFRYFTRMPSQGE